ncbi:hypothetical protein TWF694_003276 [Orbilia ellipsospora]|uniref:Uncharacterized protein n=1 Tax=Orbilia ellipsospora TaxID=2528407 RepID=A0AAV9X3I7_9PEZI
MRFTAAVLSFAALAVAQDTVWVTETVIGTDCAPTVQPTTAVPYYPSNTTLTTATPITTAVYVSNFTTTTGSAPEVPTSTPTESLPASNGAGNILPASGFALAGALAAFIAVLA